MFYVCHNIGTSTLSHTWFYILIYIYVQTSFTVKKTEPSQNA